MSKSNEKRVEIVERVPRHMIRKNAKTGVQRQFSEAVVSLLVGIKAATGRSFAVQRGKDGYTYVSETTK